MYTVKAVSFLPFSSICGTFRHRHNRVCVFGAYVCLSGIKFVVSHAYIFICIFINLFVMCTKMNVYVFMPAGLCIVFPLYAAKELFSLAGSAVDG